MQRDFPIDAVAATIRAALAAQNRPLFRELASDDPPRRAAAIDAAAANITERLRDAGWIVFQGPAAPFEASGPGFERD